MADPNTQQTGATAQPVQQAPQQGTQVPWWQQRQRLPGQQGGPAGGFMPPQGPQPPGPPGLPPGQVGMPPANGGFVGPGQGPRPPFPPGGGPAPYQPPAPPASGTGYPVYGPAPGPRPPRAGYQGAANYPTPGNTYPLTGQGQRPGYGYGQVSPQMGYNALAMRAY